MSRRVLVLVPLVLLPMLPALAAAVPALLQYPAIGRPTLVTVAGRVLTADREAKRTTPLHGNVRRLTAKSLEHVMVEVSFAGQLRRTTSGDEGEYEVSFSAPAERPFPLGMQVARASAQGVSVESRVEVVSDAAPYVVVSDLDDTIALSNVQSTRALMRAALLEDAETQPAVAGMAELYRCLRASASPPPGFAVVSGSPTAFASRVERFLARGGFPFAALHLRLFGRKTLSGYKEPVLRRLLSEMPQPFVLIGDSGERDPEVYARIRDEFPGRVAATFIRDVGRSEDPKRFQDAVLFRTPADAAREAAARGLLGRACLQTAFPDAAKEPVLDGAGAPSVKP
jgi:phosphatidate phosphatase APP1